MTACAYHHWCASFLSYYPAKAGEVRFLFVFVCSFILYVSRTTHGNRHWPNMEGMGNGWPSRSDYVWHWSGYGCRIYCHSLGGDAAASLSDMAFYTTYIQSPQGDNATALAMFVLSGCSCFTFLLPLLANKCIHISDFMSRNSSMTYTVVDTVQEIKQFLRTGFCCFLATVHSICTPL